MRAGEGWEAGGGEDLRPGLRGRCQGAVTGQSHPHKVGHGPQPQVVRLRHQHIPLPDLHPAPDLCTVLIGSIEDVTNKIQKEFASFKAMILHSIWNAVICFRPGVTTAPNSFETQNLEAF